MVTKSRRAKIKRRERYMQTAPSPYTPGDGEQPCTIDLRSKKKTKEAERYRSIREAKIRSALQRYYAKREEVKSKALKRYYMKRRLLKSQAVRRYYAKQTLLTLQERKRYHANRAFLKSRKLARYYATRESSKRVALKRYYATRVLRKREALKRYYTKRQILKSQVLKRYYAKRDSLRSQALNRYYAKRESLNVAARNRYHEQRSSILAQKRRRYASRTHCLKSKALHRYKKYTQRSGFPCNHKTLRLRGSLRRQPVRRLHATRPVADGGAPQLVGTELRGNGKRRIRAARKAPSFLIRKPTQKDINKLVSKLKHCGGLPSRLLHAELLIKWANAFRLSEVRKFKSSVRNLKGRCCKILVNIQPYLKGSGLKDLSPILGESMHTASTEAYYSDAVYKPIPPRAPAIPLRECRAEESARKTWQCEPNVCAIDVKYCIERLKRFCTLIIRSPPERFPAVMNTLDLCTSSARDPHKDGHPQSCYIGRRCPSVYLFLRTLAPHFPSIRCILRYLYSIRRAVKEINNVDDGVKFSKHRYLERVLKKMRGRGGKEYTIGTQRFSCEDDIVQKYKNSFQALTSKCNDWPTHPCMSCEKLCFKYQICFLKNLRSQPSCASWTALLNFCSENDTPRDCICKTCLQKFREGTMPATCLLNNLFVRETPPQIAHLNQFERILIQRAKCFQVVVRMGTVSKRKHLPTPHCLEKSIGRAFHLPLPMEETLKTIPRPDEPIAENMGLHILVRGVPTRNKKIWETLVDVNKIYCALSWLRENNSLYSDIVLPSVHVLDDELHDRHMILHYDDENDTTDVTESSLLQKMTAGDSFYEQYTICELSGSRPNTSASDLYQMRKTDGEPLRTFEDKDIDIKCFPDLYPFGDNGLHSERQVRLTPSEFAKLRVMSRHSQFRLNHQYLFYLMHEHDVRSLSAGIYHKQNVVGGCEQFTAATCAEAMEKGEMEQDLTVLFSRLRNSGPFWHRPRSDVETMIQYYGPVTFFLTLSPSEFRWDDLNSFLSLVNGVQPGTRSTSALIAMDPASTSRFIDHKFKAMMDFITSDEHPLGKVIHYAYRREYQTRGLQHFHVLLWIKNAPVIGESSSDEVADFISTHVTCSLPDEHKFPTLFHRVTQYQTHHHNDYCMRRKKTKSGIKSVCRFGFPRNVTESLFLRGVAESIAGRRHLKSNSRLYDIPRTADEQCINDYNPAVLLAWEGNMDIQYIGESSCALSKYITKYQTKSEKSNVSDLEFIQKKCQSVNKMLWNIGMRSLSSRECGIMEACDAILGLPLFGTDRDTIIRWVDVNMVRKRRIIPKPELMDLNPNSTDIYFPSLVDTHYPSRPAQIEQVSLFEYAAYYDVVKKKPISDTAVFFPYPPYGYVKRRSSPCLVKHQIFNITQHPEKYFFSMLLLFKPWRHISDLMEGFSTYGEAFSHNLHVLTGEMEQHHRRLQHLRTSKEEIDALVGQLSNTCSHAPPDGNTADAEVPVNIIHQITDSELQVMLSSLNADQHRIFTHVMNVISSPTDAPLRHFVSGVGGTGKSFLIKAITASIELTLGKKVAVAAPTGVAAYNVGGVTLHRLLQLPVEHKKSPEYKPLTDDVLKILRDSLKQVVLVIIDEISMVSNLTLLFIHLRLTEVFGTQRTEEGWFGNVNILVLGDLLQLPPVMADAPYHDIDKSLLNKTVKGTATMNIWKHLFTYDELTINVRQHNDREFADILGRIRVGSPNADDIAILSKRKIHLKGHTPRSRLLELARLVSRSPAALAILPTRKMCLHLNNTALSTLDSQEILLKAVDSLECHEKLKTTTLKKLSQLNCDTSETAGLEYVITIKIGCRVMIVRNLDVTLGLVNGTMGSVMGVSYDSENVVSKVIIDVGGTCHTIERVTSKFEVISGGYVHRSQFPFTLAYAISVHKSQGMTVPTCFLDIGNSIFSCGQSYVALSRLSTLEGLNLINFDPSKIRASQSAISEYNRLRSKYRPDLPVLPTTTTRFSSVPDVLWLKVDKHSLDIQENPNLPPLQDPTTLIPGFSNPDGVSCYSNATLQVIFHSDVLLGEVIVEARTSSPAPPRLAALGELAQLHASQHPNPLNTLSLRSELGEPFNTHHQQDASEFFVHLTYISRSIESAFRITFDRTFQCSQCTYTTVHTVTDTLLHLHIPQQFCRKSCSLADLVAAHFTPTLIADSTCDHCTRKGTYKESLKIHSASDMIMIHLVLWHDTVNKLNFRLRGLPTAKMTVNGVTYNMTSAIFHHGNRPTEGHYTSILRDRDSGKFIRANDTIISPLKSWPAGAQDIYMIVLSRTK